MTSQKKHDLIFKELIKRGYSLDGNTRVWNIADSKLWYLTPEQAQAYLDVESSEGYKEDIVNKGKNLIDSNMGEISEKFGNSPMNIIDLGCGDGKRAAQVVRYLIRELKSKLRYCPIDISAYMVEKAIETFSKLGVEEIIDFKYNISDFENLENIIPLLMKGNFKKNFFLLLGNTLGNFEVNELLYEIRSSMKEGDFLLIETGVHNRNVNQLATSYKNNEKIDLFFGRIPLLLGLEKKDIQFGTRFLNQRIEFYYTIKKCTNINFQDKKVKFDKGDQIIVAVAYKHDKEDLLSYLNMYFDEVVVKFSEDGSQALALCKK